MAIFKNPLISLILASLLFLTSTANFNRDVEITWGDGRGKVLNNGQLLTLSLDKSSGSGFQSRNEYLFGKIDMQIKLVPGNSASTVTVFYLKSPGSTWDEIDFEFLGNLSGDPYILHTNIYTQGKGDQEQQFYLWFDPAANFHTYSILWNPRCIIFSVDGTPIREFKNSESIGVLYPKNKPMRMYASLWNADDWATRGGLIKTDWSKAPFTASYMNLKSEACVWSNGKSSCSGKTNPSSNSWLTRDGFHKPGEDEMGTEELYDLQLLYGQKEVSSGSPPRMRNILIEEIEKLCAGGVGFLVSSFVLMLLSESYDFDSF